MTDIELPELPEYLSRIVRTEFGMRDGACVHAAIQEYARAAVEADRKKRAGGFAEYCMGACDCRTNGADPAQCELSKLGTDKP